jgi:hypothetical protein
MARGQASCPSVLTRCGAQPLTSLPCWKNGSTGDGESGRLIGAGGANSC